jgi:hypothetical protein
MTRSSSWTDQCFAGIGAADDVRHRREPRLVVNKALLKTGRWRWRMADLRSRFRP